MKNSQHEVSEFWMLVITCVRGPKPVANPSRDRIFSFSLSLFRVRTSAVHCFFHSTKTGNLLFFPQISNQNFCSKILNCKLLFVELEHMACLHPRVIIVFSTAHSFASYRLRSSTSKVLFLLNLEKNLFVDMDPPREALCETFFRKSKFEPGKTSRAQVDPQKVDKVAWNLLPTYLWVLPRD